MGTNHQLEPKVIRTWGQGYHIWSRDAPQKFSSFPFHIPPAPGNLPTSTEATWATATKIVTLWLRRVNQGFPKTFFFPCRITDVQTQRFLCWDLFTASVPPLSPYCCCRRRQHGGLSPDCQMSMYKLLQLQLKSWFHSSGAVKSSGINQGQLRKTESSSFSPSSLDRKTDVSPVVKTTKLISFPIYN